MEKTWQEMTYQEKVQAYIVAIESGQVRDTFDGFCKMMTEAMFDVTTWQPIHV